MVAPRSPWASNGGAVVVPVFVQCKLLEAQRWHRGGTKAVEAASRLRESGLQQNAFIQCWPLADHCAPILQLWQCHCIPSASFEGPLNNQPPQWPFRNCFEHVKNLHPLYTGSRPLCHLWATKKTSGCSMVAQTQTALFLCNCCSTILVPFLNHQNWCSGTNKSHKGGEWWQNHCYGGSRVAMVAELRHSGR